MFIHPIRPIDLNKVVITAAALTCQSQANKHGECFVMQCLNFFECTLRLLGCAETKQIVLTTIETDVCECQFAMVGFNKKWT